MKSRHTVSVKDQRVTISGFARLPVFIAYTQLGQ